MGARHTHTPPSLFAWLMACVPVWLLSSSTEESLFGHSCLSETLLSPFDQSVRHLSESKLCPLSSLFAGLAPARPQVPVGGSGPPLKKVPLMLPVAPNKCPAFHTVQLSDQSRVYLGYGQSRSISSPSSSYHLAPQFLWYCPSQ